MFVGVDDRPESPAAGAAWWRRCRDRPAARPAPSSSACNTLERIGKSARMPFDVEPCWRALRGIGESHVQPSASTPSRRLATGNRRPIARPATTAGSTSGDWASAWRRTDPSMSCGRESLDVVERLAVDSLDEHRGRRLADAAAVAVEIGVANRAVRLDRQFDPHHVAAQRILVLVRSAWPPGSVRGGTAPRNGPGFAPGTVRLRRAACLVATPPNESSDQPNESGAATGSTQV